MDSKLSGLLHTSLVVCFSFIYFILFFIFCFSFIFDPPSCLLSFCFFAVVYFLFYAKMRHLTRNIQIYAHAHGKEPAYYLWDLDQMLPDCLQHFVRLSVSPVVWQSLSLAEGLPKPVSGLSAPRFWLTEPTYSALIVTPFAMPRKQMEGKK